MSVRAIARFFRLRPWRTTFLATLLTGIAAAAIFYVEQRSLGRYDVDYKGRPFSAWLSQWGQEYEDYGSSTNFDDAVSQLGTNVVPALLRMLREHRPGKDQIISLLQRQKVVPVPGTPGESENYLGARGFQLLGNAASNAVPCIVHIMNRKVCSSSQAAAIEALGSMGSAAQEAVPALLKVLSEGTPLARGLACRSLSAIRKEPEMVVPRLVEHLRDPDRNVRLEAVFALGEFGGAAAEAVRALTELSASADGPLKDRAAEAISKITSGRPVPVGSSPMKSSSRLENHPAERL